MTTETAIRPGLNMPSVRGDETYLVARTGEALSIKSPNGWVDTDFQHVRFVPMASPNRITYLGVPEGMTIAVTRPAPDTLLATVFDEDGVFATLEAAVLVVHHTHVAFQVRDWYEGEDA